MIGLNETTEFFMVVGMVVTAYVVLFLFERWAGY